MDAEWRCSLCKVIVANQELFREHISTSHGDEIATTQVEELMTVSKRLIPCKVEDAVCPFCLTKPAQTQGRFASHVGKHQQEISLAALPRFDDDSDEESTDNDQKSRDEDNDDSDSGDDSGPDGRPGGLSRERLQEDETDVQKPDPDEQEDQDLRESSVNVNADANIAENSDHIIQSVAQPSRESREPEIMSPPVYKSRVAPSNGAVHRSNSDPSTATFPDPLTKTASPFAYAEPPPPYTKFPRSELFNDRARITSQIENEPEIMSPPTDKSGLAPSKVAIHRSNSAPSTATAPNSAPQLARRPSPDLQEHEIQLFFALERFDETMVRIEDLWEMVPSDTQESLKKLGYGVVERLKDAVALLRKNSMDLPVVSSRMSEENFKAAVAILPSCQAQLSLLWSILEPTVHKTRSIRRLLNRQSIILDALEKAKVTFADLGLSLKTLQKINWETVSIDWQPRDGPSN